MYQVEDGSGVPIENSNPFDLAGVLWYIHTEVLSEIPRKGNVSQIARYKVKVRNPEDFTRAKKKAFGPYQSYNAGKCVGGLGLQGCSESDNGYLVGCRRLDRSVANYVGTPGALANYQRKLQEAEVSEDVLPGGVQFSLPGPCPNKVNDEKGAACKSEFPGGLCEVADGSKTCTFSYEEAGNITLDEVSGFLDSSKGVNSYTDFWKGSFPQCLLNIVQGTQTSKCLRNVEYDPLHDKGVGCNFWDNKHDFRSCYTRIETLRDMFASKFGASEDTDQSTPRCD